MTINDTTMHFADLEHRLYSAGTEQETYEHATINLIASDNLVPAWRATNRPYNGDMIQEGIAGKRPFAGARLHDEIETIANETAEAVFGMNHAILQSHSCSQANQAVYHALLQPGDTVMSLQFRAGGHLTHGMKSNFSGRLYNFHFFGVDGSGRIDYDGLRTRAHELRPRLLVCGSSSYPWEYDVSVLREICDEVGASLMLDVSHEAGLIAGGAFRCPVDRADVITMSLDKTMRGTHGAAILCTAELARTIDSAVHPGTQSSFPIRRLTEAASALLETQTPHFREYAGRAVELGRSMSRAFVQYQPDSVFGGGTDKHYLLLDTRTAFGVDGAAAEVALERAGLLTNRQSLPSATTDRFTDAGGIRIGTAWLASAGFTSADASALVEIIVDVLAKRRREAETAQAVTELAAREKPLDVRRMSSQPNRNTSY